MFSFYLSFITHTLINRIISNKPGIQGVDLFCKESQMDDMYIPKNFVDDCPIVHNFLGSFVIVQGRFQAINWA